MGTCGSLSVQSCLTGSATLCSKHNGTARARSNAQHKFLMGRTRKSSESTKTSAMDCPTGELHMNPCIAIYAVTTEVPAHERLPNPCFVWGSKKVYPGSWPPEDFGTLVGGSEVSRTLPSEESFDFACTHCFFAHLDLIFLHMFPKPTFNLTKIYIFVTISQKIFLKCCCLACLQRTTYIWKAVTWWRKISKRHTLKFALQNYSLACWTHLPLPTLHVFGSRRALVPILEAFTLDVRVSSLSLALCLPNYLLHAGERHLQCCVGRCSGSATPPAPLLPSVISLPIVNKRIRKVKHN